MASGSGIARRPGAHTKDPSEEEFQMEIERREFFERAGLGSAALLSLPVFSGAAKSGQQQKHEHEPISGPLASATVSFGAFAADPGAATAMDRFPNKVGGPGALPNVHALTPNVSEIKAGGTVNFVIGGFHHVIVYADGKKPGDVDVTKTIPTTMQPGPPLINDAEGRIYRGLDPSLFLQDRVEVVQFTSKGLFLVICGVLPHFAVDGMYGWVKVV
jgi:hypothetical protein